MKAVFHKTAEERLLQLRVEADRTNRKIDYVLVTPEEYDEIRRSARDYYIDYRRVTEGLDIETVMLYRKGYTQPMRFMVRPETIYGLRIVVAPAEYH
jgi:hypothetical protein